MISGRTITIRVAITLDVILASTLACHTKAKATVNFSDNQEFKVFQRPYRYFSIVLKVFFSLSDRYKIFTSNWRWIEICENLVLRTFALIVSAHPFWARKSTCHVIHRARALSGKLNSDRADGHCYSFDQWNNIYSFIET